MVTIFLLLCSEPCATLKDNCKLQNNFLQSVDPSKQSSNFNSLILMNRNFNKQVPCGFVRDSFFGPWMATVMQLLG